MSGLDWADLVTVVVAVAIAVRAIRAIRAWRYVEGVYRNRVGDVSELARIVERDRFIAIGGAIILAIVGWSLANFSWPQLVPPIPRPFGSLAIGAVIWIMLRGPIEDAKAWRHLRGER